MKKIAFVALALIAGTAFANGNQNGHSNGNGHNNGAPASAAQGPFIDVNAALMQVTVVSHTGINNKATGGGSARQNVSSNMGNVDINKATIQVTAAEGSWISNTAKGQGAVSNQSLASNMGNVDVGGRLLQVVAAHDSSIVNKAGSGSKAVQNVSTNNGCASCQ